jgi:hypothetical protein
MKDSESNARQFSLDCCIALLLQENYEVSLNTHLLSEEGAAIPNEVDRGDREDSV